MTEHKHPGEINYLEYLAVPVCAVDANGKVTFWNAQMAATTGQPADAVIGKKAWAGLLAQRGSTPLDEALSSGERVEATLALTHRQTGKTESVKFTATPILNPGDEDPSGAVGTFVSQGAGDEATRLRSAIDGSPSSIGPAWRCGRAPIA